MLSSISKIVRRAVSQDVFTHDEKVGFFFGVFPSDILSIGG
jgi:hypothetical protein